MSKSPTITDNEADWLENPHAGSILASEFMEPLGLSPEALATALEVASARIDALIDNRVPVDGELDLRLGRYFGISEGFFLRLQNSYVIEEAKRSAGGAIDRITRRAA